MQYVQESLSPGEKILKISQYHWFYVLKTSISALLYLVLAYGIFFFSVLYHYYDPLKLVPWKIMAAASQLSLGDYARAFWHTNIIARALEFLLIIVAFLQLVAAMLVVATTEMAVTTKRVVLKRGLISRKVEQMRTDFIEGDDLKQTVLGRIFDYGQVKIFGTGTESMLFPIYLTDPVGFRRALQTARTLSVQEIAHPQVTPALATVEGKQAAAMQSTAT